MAEFKELEDVIDKYNSILSKYKTNDELKSEEIDFVCGIDFEIAKALVMKYPETSVKIAKIILAHIGE